MRGNYVQYDGKGRKPPSLAAYIARSDGEYPPYIPLPTRMTTFVLGDGYRAQRRVRWKGHGRLNAEIVDYVRENGVLPSQA